MTRARAVPYGQHHDEKPDRAEADHCDRLARADARPPPGVQGDGSRLEHGRLLQRDCVGKAVQHVGGDDGAFGHPAVAHQTGEAEVPTDVVLTGLGIGDRRRSGSAAPPRPGRPARARTRWTRHR